MKPEEIHLNDILRILMGEVPISFFIEAFIRVLFLFLLLVVSMRLLGRRMAAMLNMHELSVLIALGAAIGVPIQTPDRGILPAFLIAILVVGLQKTIFFLGYKYKRFELLVHGNINLLIEDGVLNLGHLKRTLLTKERIFGVLRSKGIINLGEVQRLYIETNGCFTLLTNDNPRPGLSVIPEYDEEFTEKKLQIADNTYSCSRCGNTQESHSVPQKKCELCHYHKWESSVAGR